MADTLESVVNKLQELLPAGLIVAQSITSIPPQVLLKQPSLLLLLMPLKQLLLLLKSYRQDADLLPRALAEQLRSWWLLLRLKVQQVRLVAE